MDIKVGTFNLNNLFSRFNFRAQVDELPPDEREVTVTYEFDEEGDSWFRTFRGRLIQPMPDEQRQGLAGQIKAMDLDPALASKQWGAWIDRRTKHGGDGSDHDPAWVVLVL